jgi:hypothetical protein
MSDVRYVPVKESPGLFRDSLTGAIINMNKNGAQKAREARQALINKENEIQDLKTEVQEIKSILTQLLERL